MKGSIRFFSGLLITYGAVGGIDNGSAIVPALLIAVVGLVIMASGAMVLRKN